MKSLKGKRRYKKKCAKLKLTKFTICDIKPDEFSDLARIGKGAKG